MHLEQVDDKCELRKYPAFLYVSPLKFAIAAVKGGEFIERRLFTGWNCRANHWENGRMFPNSCNYWRCSLDMQWSSTLLLRLERVSAANKMKNVQLKIVLVLQVNKKVLHNSFRRLNEEWRVISEIFTETKNHWRFKVLQNAHRLSLTGKQNTRWQLL